MPARANRLSESEIHSIREESYIAEVNRSKYMNRLTLSERGRELETELVQIKAKISANLDIREGRLVIKESPF